MGAGQKARVICLVCRRLIEDGDHGPCVIALMERLAAAIRDNSDLAGRLQDAGILTRSKK